MSQIGPSQSTQASSSAPLRPPYDPLLLPKIEAERQLLGGDFNLNRLRKVANSSTLEAVLKAQPNYHHKEYVVPGLNSGDAYVTLSVFTLKESISRNRPAFYMVHGGGQVAGNRFSALQQIMEYVADADDMVIITVEYRVAPEYPAPAGLHDCYAGLLWTIQNFDLLRIDTRKIIAAGGSGGAPLTVGMTMMCRNNSQEFPCALLAMTPMLDDRNCTVSSRQYASDGPWCSNVNRRAWGLTLGKESGGEPVGDVIAPARASNLKGFPPTFVDAGECEVFRDEAVAFASQLWKCGVSAELHVWPGAYHGFDLWARGVPVARASIDVKKSWVTRILQARERELAFATVSRAL
ncbi:hypothetical protein ACHAPJ_005207 [Fusarium lateritium]